MVKVYDELKEREIKNFYGFVYITTNLVNGKKYVGQTKVTDRFHNYFGSGKLILKALKKYGRENFKKEIVYIATSKEELDSVEEEYIKLHNANRSKEYYNLISGSAGSSNNFENKTDEEMRIISDKISKANKGKMLGSKNPMFGKSINKGISKSDEAKINMSLNHCDVNGPKNPMYGIKRSDEEKQKISNAIKGKFAGEKNPMFGRVGKKSKPVLLLDKDGTVLMRFEKTSEVIGDWRLEYEKPNSKRYVENCLRNRKLFHGCRLVYEEEYNE